MVAARSPEVLDDIHEQHAEADRHPRGRVRKPRPKPERRIRLALGLNDEGRNAVVAITVGKDEPAHYFVDRIPADWGTAYEVEKIGGEDGPYHVHLDGQHRSCTCKGFSRWNHCRHADGLAKLAELGKLPAAPTATPAVADAA
jgi:hypothetical protein